MGNFIHMISLYSRYSLIITLLKDIHSIIENILMRWNEKLLTYHIADDPLIPFDLTHAGTALRDIFEDLEETLTDRFPSYELDLTPLSSAVSSFEEAGKRISTLAKQALALNDTVLLSAVNAAYKAFSRGFASEGLLPGRFSFYNVVSAPGLDSGYGADVFPAVQDSLDQGNLTQAEEWVQRSAKAVLRAAEILKIGE